MAPPTPATAQPLPPGLREATAFFNFLGSFNRRNSVCSEARRTRVDVDAYYDKLRHELAEDLVKGEMPTAPWQKPVRSLFRMTHALERERDAATAQIEAEKNDARRIFNSEVGANLFDLLVRPSGGQQLISDIQSNIDRLRQAVELVQEAADCAALDPEHLERRLPAVDRRRPTTRWLNAEAGPEGTPRNVTESSVAGLAS